MPNSNQDVVELVQSYTKVPLTVDCVLFGFEENTLQVLLIKSDLSQFNGKLSLLGDQVHNNENLDTAAYRVLHERTGMKKVYLEQVQTFSQPNRHPGGRVVTTVYASLLNIKHHALEITDNDLKWHPVHQIMEMAFDHKEILDCCYHWLQKRIQEHPLAYTTPSCFQVSIVRCLFLFIKSLTDAQVTIFFTRSSSPAFKIVIPPPRL